MHSLCTPLVLPVFLAGESKSLIPPTKSTLISDLLRAAVESCSMTKLMLKPLLGTLLDGRYKVISILESPAVPTTYLALDTTQTDQPKCIVKEIEIPENYLNNWSEAWDILAQFGETLRLLGLHQQIPSLLASFYQGKSFYWVEEFTEGEPLTAELKTGKPWSQEDVTAMLGDLMGVLQYAHSLGVLHGDLKPEKIIRRHSDGKLVVTGFALTKDVWMPPFCNLLLAENSPLSTQQNNLPSSSALTKNPYLPFSFDSLYQPSAKTDIYALAMIGMRAQTGMSEEQLNVYYDSQIWGNLWSFFSCQEEQNQQVDVPQQVLLDDDDLTRDLWLTEESLPSEPSVEKEQEFFTPSTPVEEKADDSLLDCSEGNRRVKSDNPRKHKTRSSGSRLVVTAGLAAGMGANAVALAFGMYNLLLAAPVDPGLDTFAKATQEYKAGDLKGAIKLATEVPRYSAAYYQAKDASVEWQKTLDLANRQVSKIKKATEEKRWRDVLAEADKLPALPTWHKKVEPMVKQATTALAPEINKLIKVSSEKAKAKDFSGAIKALSQIPKGLPNYGKIQVKIDEYSQKQHIKNEVIGQRLLQQAYKRAQVKDYTGAIKTLRQVPKGTKAYTTAQAKRVDFAKRLRGQGKNRSGVPVAPAAQRSSSPRAAAPHLGDMALGLNPGDFMQEINPGAVFLTT